jgi:hypothetical protein
MPPTHYPPQLEEAPLADLGAGLPGKILAETTSWSRGFYMS